MPRQYWLLKSEPDSFSIDDLAKAPKKTTDWGGVRNYQARNFLRDRLAVGDLAFYYHSNAHPPGIAGLASITRAGYPDSTQFDPQSDYYDADSSPENPRWYCVDVRFEKKFDRILSLDELRGIKELRGMVLLNKSRLSVQPVSKDEWDAILRYADSKR